MDTGFWVKIRINFQKRKSQGWDEKWNIKSDACKLRCSQPWYKRKESWKDWKMEQGQHKRAVGQGCFNWCTRRSAIAKAYKFEHLKDRKYISYKQRVMFTMSLAQGSFSFRTFLQLKSQERLNISCPAFPVFKIIPLLARQCCTCLSTVETEAGGLLELRVWVQLKQQSQNVVLEKSWLFHRLFFTYSLLSSPSPSPFKAPEKTSELSDSCLLCSC